MAARLRSARTRVPAYVLTGTYSYSVSTRVSIYLRTGAGSDVRGALKTHTCPADACASPLASPVTTPYRRLSL